MIVRVLDTAAPLLRSQFVTSNFQDFPSHFRLVKLRGAKLPSLTAEVATRWRSGHF